MSKDAAGTATESGRPKSAVLRFRLEMDMSKFVKVKDDFLADIAGAIDVPADALRVVDVRRGCVLASVEIDDLTDDIRFLLMAIDSGLEVHDELRKVLRKYNVTAITEESYFRRPYLGRFAAVHRRLVEPGRRLTWLHISDLHARPTLARGMSYQDEVASQFVEDLPRLLREFNLEPDFVFFTGDLTYSGHADEYVAAQSFIERIYEALPTDPLLFTVPGNHDVTWRAIKPSSDDVLDQDLQNDHAVHDFFYKDETKYERDVVRLRFEEYLKFVKNVAPLGHPDIAPYEFHYSGVVDHHGFTLGIAGLNSAWRSTSRQGKPTRSDHGRLLVGAAQLKQAYQHLRTTDMRIALLHHPPDSESFKDFDRRAQRNILPKFDFVLRGHEHFPAAIGVQQIGTGNEWIHIPAGALYNTDGTYPKSANAVMINLDNGEGLAFFWRHFEENFKWRADVGLVENGQAFFELPEKLVQRLAAARHRSAEATPDDGRDDGLTRVGTP